MAKQSSLFKVQGTLDDVTFFELDGKHYIRKKSRLKGDRVRFDPEFERTQENFREFGTVGVTTRQIRTAFAKLVRKTADKRFSRRLNSVLHQVKKLDIQHKRGTRTVTGGLDTAEGRLLLTGFQFNPVAVMHQVVTVKPQFAPDTATITLAGLVTKEDLVLPPGATHVQFTGVWSRIDFDQDTHVTETTVLDLLPIDEESRDVVLSPSQPLTGDGRDLVVLQVAFLKEEGGDIYPLKDSTARAAAIIAVA